MMNKENNITMMHISAALMVIIGHEFTLLGVQSPSVLGLDINGLGVRILFVISGYLIFSSFDRSRSSIFFLIKRIIRLYPPLILCLLVTIISMQFITLDISNYWPSAIDYFVNNITMKPSYDIAGVFEINNINRGVNGSLWTLPIEIGCYIFIIPFCIIVKRLTDKNKEYLLRIIVITVLIILSVFNLYKIHILDSSLLVWRNVDWYNGLELIEYFFVGFAISIINKKVLLNGQVAVLLILFLLCAPSKIEYLLTPWVIGYATMSFALPERPLFSKTIKQDICYEIYLYSFPMQQLFINYFYKRMPVNVYIYLMLTVPCVIIVSVFAYILNRRFIKLLYRRGTI